MFTWRVSARHEYPESVRLLRAIGLALIGFWAGVMAAAAIMRRVLHSRGDADSDEVALVAIFDGIELESRASAFRGGSMLAWFGSLRASGALPRVGEIGLAGSDRGPVRRYQILPGHFAFCEKILDRSTTKRTSGSIAWTHATSGDQTLLNRC